MANAEAQEKRKKRGARVAAVTCGTIVVVVVLCVLLWGTLTRRARPLPFTGPRRGMVVDATTGKPIANATVTAAWTLHDNPLPDGPGHKPLSVTATTDATGAFTLVPPKERGGLSQTDHVVKVEAPGYIGAVMIVDPRMPALPPSTVTWPFVRTTVHKALPETMTIKLEPARPVLLKALKSKDKLIRDTAQEELRKLDAAGQ